MKDFFIEFSGQEYSSSDKRFRDNVNVTCLKSKLIAIAKTPISEAMTSSGKVSYWLAEQEGGDRFIYRVSKEEYERVNALMKDESKTAFGKLVTEVKTLNGIEVE